uniref:t-SNARE coiled-coil homology domain-containing protein n=1 Tax=Rhabditophanes sp. KR3021 TaxID=114890 RepID=A0AC35UBF2_9BILA
MPRDRLSEFRRKVDDPTNVFDSIDRNPSMDIAMGENLSAREQLFNQTTEEILQSISDLKERVDLVKRKQTDILAQTVVDSREKEELEKLLLDIKNSIKLLRPRIKRIEADLKAEELNGTMQAKTGAFLRIRRNRCDLIKKKLNDVIIIFGETQVDYKSRVSKRVKRQLDLAGEHLSENDVNNMLESNSQEIFYNNVSPISLAGRMALDDATSRHNELLKLEHSIKELQDIFADVTDLVESQSTMVDNIEANIESAVDYTADGRINVVQAVRHKKAAIRKKIYVIGIIVLILIILIVLAIVLGVVFGKKKCKKRFEKGQKLTYAKPWKHLMDKLKKATPQPTLKKKHSIYPFLDIPTDIELDTLSLTEF